MTRPAALRRVIALRALAAQASHEGATAARLARQLAERHHLADAEIEAAAAERDREDVRRAPLLWAEPWLVDLAVQVALRYRCGCRVGNVGTKGIGIEISGPNAGRAAHYAEQLRAAVVAESPDPDAAARLPVFGLFSLYGSATLGGTPTGITPLDVWRSLRVRAILGGVATAPAPEPPPRPVTAPVTAPEAPPSPQAAPPPSAPADTPEPQEAPEPPPPPSAEERRLLQEVSRLVGRTRTMLGVVAELERIRPRWVRDLAPPATTALVPAA